MSGGWELGLLVLGGMLLVSGGSVWLGLVIGRWMVGGGGSQ